jgi:hypothetical protein
MNVKECRDCYQEKELHEFPPDKRRVLGRGSYCYKCCNKRQLVSKHKNADHYRQYIKEYMRARRGFNGNEYEASVPKNNFVEELKQRGCKFTSV